MDSSNPADLVSAFRDAVSSGEYARAEEIWNAYAACLLEEVRRGRGALLSEAGSLIDWTRSVALCQRSHALRRLRLQIAEGYAASQYVRNAP